MGHPSRDGDWRVGDGRWEVPTEVAALHFSRWASKSGQTGPDWTAFLGPIHSHLHLCPLLQPLVLSAYVGARGKHIGLRLSEMVPFPGRTRTTNWGINCCVSSSGSKSD